MLWIWTAFSLGLFGSLHCAGMCGPIAMALPLSIKEKRSIIAQSLLYNFGRIASYSLMGLVMGLLGWGVLLAGYQKSLSIALGVAMIISAILSFSVESAFLRIPLVTKSYNLIKSKLSSAMANQSGTGAVKIGFINGFLPCGMVYVALAGALSSGNSMEGAAYMALFGLGTIPMMTGLILVSNVNRQWILKLRKLLPVIMFIFGLLLIKRGLALDIPLEMKFWEAANFPTMCH